MVTYSDNSTSTFTQSVSDWCGPQNYPGETKALAMTYRVSPSAGTVALACNVYAYAFQLNSAKTVSSITLPANRNVAFLAITLSGQTVSAAPQAQIITFNAIPSQVVGGTLTVSATASSGLPVSYSVVPNGNCSVSGSVVTFLNTGNCGVIAHQAGNGSYSAAPDVGQIIVVINGSSGSFTIAPSASSFKLAAGQGGTLNFTATSANGFNGTVAYSLSGSPLNPATSGISYTFLQQSPTVATLVVYVSPGVTAGSSKITVTGTSGSTSASTTFTFNY